MMGDRSFNKQRIATAFGEAAQGYDSQAEIQHHCAQRLLDLLAEHEHQIPPGAILELGCGTGLVTRGLVQRWSDRPMDITDLSPQMLDQCQTQLQTAMAEQICFYGMDGEQLQPRRAAYAVAIAAFVIQWFQRPIESLQALLDCLTPGGLLVLSFPSDQSFPEWKHLCQTLHLPYTANPLPNTQQLIEALTPRSRLLACQTCEVATTRNNALTFFQEMKAIGAGFNTTGKHLTAPQMRRLIQRWNQCETIQLSQQIVFLVLQQV